MRHGHLLVVLLLATEFSVAHAAEITESLNGSYAANGQCYCLGEISPTVGGQIIPTPIGGQSIAQVCEKLGEGPGLELSDGRYNYPLYQDLQCGHGPFADPNAKQVRDSGCVGTLDHTYATCQGVGPRWDLQRAISVQPALAAAEPVSSPNSKDSESSLSIPLEYSRLDALDIRKRVEDREAQIRFQEKLSQKQELQSADKSESDAVTKLDLESFEGITATIDGQRYLKARDGIGIIGGPPGSRIILDGQVYLKDDGYIDPADIYRNDATQSAVNQLSEEQTNPDEALSGNTQLSETGLNPDESLPDGNQLSEQLTNPEGSQASGTSIAIRDQSPESSEISDELSSTHNARKKTMGVAKQQLQAAMSDDQLLSNRVTEMETVDVVSDGVKPEPVIDEVLRKLRLAELAQQRKIETEIKIGSNAQLEPEEQEAVSEASKQVDTSDGSSDSMDAVAGGSAIASALRLPPSIHTTPTSFSYIEALPADFDFGGSGLMLEASAQSHQKFQYLGRIGIAGDYRKFFLGGGYYLTPARATRLKVVLLAGVEHGDYELRDEQLAPGLTFNATDSGWHVGAHTRLTVNSKFELSAGVGHSSFFEGDTQFFGGGFYHITKQLDLMSRFELGDNDLIGIGVRYYY
ncbi:MAG: porin family protein [Granulosicoccus sp.]|nr:porin family protein [Granulosicoccus sp.]